MSPGPAFERFLALGSVVVVGAATPAALPEAVRAARAEIEACDLACSRFRPDSELSHLNQLRGRRRVTASPWLAEAVATALAAARQTGGLVDPTIGQCLIELGYDRTFEDLRPDDPVAAGTSVPAGAPVATGASVVVTARHIPAWQKVRVDPRRRTLSVPAGVRLDLGATAKALCADRAAARAAAAVGAAAADAGAGVLVSLGGDIAVAGRPPEGGWIVRVTDRSDADPASAPGQTVAIGDGGLATSGTSARRWSRRGRPCHHLVDPRTGRPAEETWRTASVAAPTCVQANIASTAAIILGADAPAWLDAQGLDARLVTPGGDVVTTGRWPEERRPETGAA